MWMDQLQKAIRVGTKLFIICCKLYQNRFKVCQQIGRYGTILANLEAQQKDVVDRNIEMLQYFSCYITLCFISAIANGNYWIITESFII